MTHTLYRKFQGGGLVIKFLLQGNARTQGANVFLVMGAKLLLKQGGWAPISLFAVSPTS